MAKAYVGDIGTVIEVETGTDLTTATVQKIKVKKPSATVEWVASVKAPATDGIITYTIISGDFNEAGEYLIQAYVEFGTDHWLGETKKLVVYEAYK